MASSRRILVTGATGLIGNALTDQLVRSGDETTVVVRPGTASAALPPGCAVHELDLARPFGRDDLPSGPFDAMVHLAQHPNYASFPVDAGVLAELNVAATCRLAESAPGLGASQFVFASSGGIYGSSPNPVTEDAPVSPPTRLGFYLVAKAATEQLLAPFREHLAVTCVRYFFVYGPRQQTRFLLPRLISRVRAGEPITVAGGRGPRINPVHVHDAAAATVACIRPDAPETINVAGPEIATISEIARRIGVLVDREPILVDVDDAPDDLVADITRLREHFEPLIGLDPGLATLCEERPEAG
jgi:nucleoside-diphosphate-sugar epimerase